MWRRASTIQNFVLILAFALLATACGGDDDVDRGGEATASDPVEDPTQPEGTDTQSEPAVDDADIEFNALGVDSSDALLEFGTDARQTIDLVSTYLGAPTDDTGETPTDAACPTGAANYRIVRWGDVSITFLDGAFSHWLSTDADRSAIAFVGDQTTMDILPGHTTVAEMRATLSEAVEVFEEDPFGPAFTVNDNWGELFGSVTDTSDEGTVQSVGSGNGCGE